MKREVKKAKDDRWGQEEELEEARNPHSQLSGQPKRRQQSEVAVLSSIVWRHKKERQSMLGEITSQLLSCAWG